MKRYFKSLALLGLILLWPLGAFGQSLVELPGDSPLIQVRVQFLTGAADDPESLPGTAHLTSALLSQGGSQDRSYGDLLELFYPWAVSVDSTVDKEMTTFSAAFHRDHLDLFTPVLVEMLTRPGFHSDDLARLKEQTKNFLTQELRANNDEELGKEVLYLQLTPSYHPYGHHNLGTLTALDSVTEEHLRDFYHQNFHPENLVLGVAGGYPDGYPQELLETLKANLPQDQVHAVEGGRVLDIPHGLGKTLRAALPQPPNRPTKEAAPELPLPVAPHGRRVTLVEKDTRSVALSLGFPIEVNRAHPDWAALNLVRSFLGEHRSSNSHLYQRLREARGLNYGNYAYIEYFPRGMFLMRPEPNYARRQQLFSIWVRPVQPENALFTLRATLFELEKLVRDGLTEEQFEATRSFLLKNAPVLVESSSTRLGYELDQKYYGLPSYVPWLRAELQKLTLEDVNEALRRHLQADNLEIVMVTKSAGDLRAELLKGAPSPIEYNSPKPDDILQEDRVIEGFPLNLSEVRVVPVSSVFR